MVCSAERRTTNVATPVLYLLGGPFHRRYFLGHFCCEGPLLCKRCRGHGSHGCSAEPFLPSLRTVESTTAVVSVAGGCAAVFFLGERTSGQPEYNNLATWSVWSAIQSVGCVGHVEHLWRLNLLANVFFQTVVGVPMGIDVLTRAGDAQRVLHATATLTTT